MAADMRETEIKYEATAGTSLPRFENLPQVARTCAAADEQLDAEYFDTEDLRLIQAGITLRRREGGHDAGWHLKLPAGTYSRREIRLPLGKSGLGVPDQLVRLVLVHTRGSELKPVARISTARQRQLLLDGSGKSLAEVASDDVTARTLGGSTRVSKWQEIEVELTGGDRGVLTAADGLLRHDGISRSGQSAKLARALGLPPPEPVGQPPLETSAPAGRVVLGYLSEQVGALKSLDPMVRGSEPDSVHQMRITSRRLRSAFQSFGQFFGSSVTGPLEVELQWLGTVLGQARDAEVLAERMTQHVDQIPAGQLVGPVQKRVRGHFADLCANAQAAVLDALDSPRYLALLDQLDLLLAEPPYTNVAARPAGDALPAAVRRSYARTSRRMKRALREPVGERRDLALHRARKAAKRARYAGEAVAPLFGKKAGRFARQMKQLQSVLGEHQDAVIARQVEQDLGISAHLAGENAFSYGLMYERDDQAAMRLQKQAKRTWRRASRARYRRWLR